MLALTKQLVTGVIMAEPILAPCKPCKKCGESNRYPSGKCKPCGDAAEKYKANPDKCKEYNANWYRNNPEAVSVKNQNRRARVRSVGGKLSKGLPEKLFSLQQGKCACCGLPLGDKYHLDHIVPLALGGTNTDDNIQLLRASCNNQKHAKHPVDFMRERGFLL
jgi:5-methylcytosine-specific restriction endonuclease McrA